MIGIFVKMIIREILVRMIVNVTNDVKLMNIWIIKIVPVKNV